MWRVLGNVLFAVVVVSGLVGAVLLARPALDVSNLPSPREPEAAQNP